MYHETVTGLDEPPLNGKHPDTYFGDAGRGENSRAEEIMYNSASTSFPTWEPLSDRDSVDSLFLTQHEAQPVRTVRRQRPEGDAPNPLAAGEPLWENEESSSPHGPREAPSKPRKSHKASQRRRSVHSYKRLNQRKTLTCELAALGGFFKRVMEMKVSKRRKKRCYKDTKRCMSPLPDPDEGEDNEGIKIVDLRDFIPKYKIARKGYLPWLDRNDPVDTVAEKTKDVSVTPSISDSGSGSLASDSEAGIGESERSESEAECQPVPYPSSGRVSSCMAEALGSRFRRGEMQPVARRASNPDSEMATGVEKLRTTRKDTVRQQRAAAERPPHATLSQAGVSEEEARTEHLPVRDFPVTWLLAPGDLGNSQGGKTREEEEEVEGEEGSLWEAKSQGDRELEGENKGQESAMVSSAGRKNKILPVPVRKDEKRGTWTDEESNVGLQGSVREERVTVPDLVQVETEDIAMETVEGITPSVTEGQPAELLRGDEQSKRKEVDDEESVDLPPDSVPEEGGTAGGAAEPDPHPQPPRDWQRQIQDKEYCSRVGEGEHSILNFSVPEPVGDSASGDAICEEGIRKKKKKKRKKDKSGNVEEYINEPPCETLSDSLHLTPEKEKSSGARVGESSHLISIVPEAVSDSRDVICEEGLRKKKKKRKKDNDMNAEEHESEPPCDSLCLTDDKQKNSEAGVGEHSLISNVPEGVSSSTSCDVICEEGIRKKKKKRKKDNDGNAEEHESEPPCDSLCLTDDKQKNSEAGVGEHSLISSVPEGVSSSTSGDVICEEGIRKKKKKRKKDNDGNAEEHESEPPRDSLCLTDDKQKNSEAGVGEHSLISSVPEGISSSTSGDVICEEGIRKKKKRKKDKSVNVEEYITEPPCETLSDTLHLTPEKEKSFGAGVGEHSFLISSVPEGVSSSTSCDFICEEGIRKKKKKRKKDNDGNVEEHGSEPLSHTLKDSQTKTQDKDRSSTAGEMEHSHSKSSNPESVDDSDFSHVICEKGIRKKKKKRKRDNCENMEEQVGKPLPHMPKDKDLYQTKYKEKSLSTGATECYQLQSKISEPVNSSASCEVVCEERTRKKKIKKRKGGHGMNVCEQVS
ncbi:aspartoacylase isoform X2 [Anguilla anguilla]|uniref:aspartoacylase isoform X2 n=1 Tax=Anguilla anguilla TaxID=7936 RepID=UPI0015B30955|nr:aspartoacylase isoform X2 [Anguilla anguilla]